ncbi:MAG: hypothetical protein R3352_00085 [Salinisphaeraceae bacterium]|nr:hypothetical protein [Salinisphaeraceae bacterium]
MSEVKPALQQALGQPAEALAFLETLSKESQNQLTADIEAARKAHKKEIIASLNEALDHVPRLLRGPIRKIFGV